MSHQPKFQKFRRSSPFQMFLLAGITLTVIFIFYLNFHFNFNFSQTTHHHLQQPLRRRLEYPSQAQTSSYNQLQSPSPNPSQSQSEGQNLKSPENELDEWNTVRGKLKREHEDDFEKQRGRSYSEMDKDLYPPPWRLIDLKIQYLLNTPICSGSLSEKFGIGKQDKYKGKISKEAEAGDEAEKILVIILITSHAAHFRLRAKLREIVSKEDLKRLGMRRAFLLAKTGKGGNSKTEDGAGTFEFEFDLLRREHEEYGDLVMGSFTESYHNLTYKHLMGLQWATRYCSQAHFILKQDDDILVDYYQLAHILHIEPTSSFNKNSKLGNLNLQEIVQKLVKGQSQGQTKSEAQRQGGEGSDPQSQVSKFIAGKPLEKQRVIRDPKSKWFVTRSEFPSDFYPTFVSGWAYLTTIPTAVDLLVQANDESKSNSNFGSGSGSGSGSKYFWIDDVHVTGTLRRAAKIDQVIDLSEIFTQYKGHLMCCLTPSHVQRRVGHEPFWCDFVIGPTMDDWTLFSNLHQHARFCYTSQVCVRRDDREQLNRTCVVTQQSLQSSFSIISNVHLGRSDGLLVAEENSNSKSYSVNRNPLSKSQTNRHYQQQLQLQQPRGRGEWSLLNL